MKPQLYLLDEVYTSCAYAYADQHVQEHPPILLEVLRAVNAEAHPLKKHILVRLATGPTEYSWLYRFTQRLLLECEHRFHVDKSELMDALRLLPLPTASPNHKPKRWLQLLPKAEAGQAVKAYRQYYQDTYSGASWTKRGPPEWWVAATQQALPFND